MNFAPDNFETTHRRKRLAAWLGTLRGPVKVLRTSTNSAVATSGGGGGTSWTLPPGQSFVISIGGGIPIEAVPGRS